MSGGKPDRDKEPQLIDAASLEEALSPERFSRYVTWARGDRTRALGLYALNMRLSESLYTPMQMLEVALRNRIKESICTRKTGQSGERNFGVLAPNG